MWNILDFKKAFALVNHEILISKLERYGFRGVVKKWLSSYITPGITHRLHIGSNTLIYQTKIQQNNLYHMEFHKDQF